MEDYIKREEYNASIGRIHDKVNEIKESVVRSEEASRHIENFTQQMHKVVYGNGQDGIIAKVKDASGIAKGNRALILLLLVAIIGGAIKMFLK